MTRKRTIQLSLALPIKGGKSTIEAIPSAQPGRHCNSEARSDSLECIDVQFEQARDILVDALVKSGIYGTKK
jgi:hypothetical protein